MDLLGEEIKVGDYVLFPEGACFKTGIVKRATKKRVHIVGVFLKKIHSFGDRIASRRKVNRLCIIVGEEKVKSHEEMEFMRVHPTGVRTCLNREGRFIIEQDVEKYVEERMLLLNDVRNAVLNGEFPENLDRAVQIENILDERSFQHIMPKGKDVGNTFQEF